MIEDFMIAADSLNNTTTSRYFEFWKKVLEHGPSEKFKRLKANNGIWYGDTAVGQTVLILRFQTAIQNFVKLYCTSTDHSKGRSNQTPQIRGLQEANEGSISNPSRLQGIINEVCNNVRKIESRSLRGRRKKLF